MARHARDAALERARRAIRRCSLPRRVPCQMTHKQARTRLGCKPHTRTPPLPPAALTLRRAPLVRAVSYSLPGTDKAVVELHEAMCNWTSARMDRPMDESCGLFSPPLDECFSTARTWRPSRARRAAWRTRRLETPDCPSCPQETCHCRCIRGATPRPPRAARTLSNDSRAASPCSTVVCLYEQCAVPQPPAPYSPRPPRVRSLRERRLLRSLVLLDCPRPQSGRASHKPRSLWPSAASRCSLSEQGASRCSSCSLLRRGVQLLLPASLCFRPFFFPHGRVGGCGKDSEAVPGVWLSAPLPMSRAPPEQGVLWPLA